jgi:hypothetical protein
MRRFVLYLVCGALAFLLVTPAVASAATFYVHPSCGNDTANIQKAFNAAVKAGPGSTVQLSAGHFYTNTIVVSGFNGTFRGAGEGKTLLDTVRGIDPSAVPLGPVTLDNAGSQIAPWPSLYGFEGGSLCVSDMTAAISDPTPGQGWSDYGTPTTALGTVFQVTNARSATFARVAVHDGGGDYDGFNVTSDISVTGRQYLNADGLPTNLGTTGGSFAITACSFSGENGLFCSGLTHGSLTVSGSVLDSTVCYYGFDASDSRITVTGNRMDARDCGLQLEQGDAASFGAGAPLPALPAPHYVIANNQISGGAPGWAGVGLFDDDTYYDAAPRLDAALTGNDFELSGGDGFCGVAEYGTRNILCARNSFSGDASWGIYLGDDPDQNSNYVTVSGWRILGDDFSGLTASVAPIVLGAGTTHNLVSPTPAGTIDNGVDNWLLNPLHASASGLSAAPLLRSLSGATHAKQTLLPRRTAF